MEQTDKQTGAGPLANSNAMVLSPRQAVIAGAIVLVALALAGPAWKHIDRFDPVGDFRVPYRLGEDYWLYDRWARHAAAEDELLIVGDSVVWGHYVEPDQTLSAHLGRALGGRRVANLGVDGIHPAALAGLMKWHGRGIRGRRVILHCNPLWLTSKAADLRSGKKDPRVNHPRMVAQLYPPIPDYKQNYSERIGVCVERLLPFRNLARHMQWIGLGGADVPGWTVRHPYRCPVRAVLGGRELSDELPVRDPTSWEAQGMGREDLPWVPLDESLQWRFFIEAVHVLRGRGNSVLVVIGPFNEHMLTDASRQRYVALKTAMAEGLRDMGVPCVAPGRLPSEEYADASHPLAAGYARLAEMLRADEAFAAFNTPETKR